MKRLIAVLAVVSLFGVNAPAANRLSRYVSDEIVKSVVERNLAEYGGIQVSVDDRIVTLNGSVPSLKIRHDVEKRAWKANDGVRVENHLTILSNRTDEQLAADVSSAIRRHPLYDIFDWVDGRVVNGTVTLTGMVRQPWRKTDYEAAVENVAGVKKIDNQIHTTALSSFDDELRRDAALAIYNDPSFRHYASQANPPIHVVVEKGRVRLEGVVMNQMERQLAEAKVRSSVMAFDVVNNLRIE